MKTDVTQRGQSIVDLAIQKYGAAEGVVFLIADNPMLVKNWHDDPEPGTVVYIKTAPVNSRVEQYYTNNAISPATLPQMETEGAFLLTNDGDYLVTNNDQPIETQ